MQLLQNLQQLTTIIFALLDNLYRTIYTFSKSKKFKEL